MRYRPSLKELSEALSSIERCSLSQKRMSEVISKLAEEVETVFISNSEKILLNVENLSNISKNLQLFLNYFSPLIENLSGNAEGIKRLSENIEKLNSYLAEIEKIASETELIAINASIEAARAGESGRNFAVVANEIKNMSKFTFKILREIQNINKEIEQKINLLQSTVNMVEKLQKTNKELTESINELTKISKELLNIYKEQKVVSKNIRGLSGIAVSSNKIYNILISSKKNITRGFLKILHSLKNSQLSHRKF